MPSQRDTCPKCRRPARGGRCYACGWGLSRNPAKRVRHDRDAMRELELYIDNTEPLYRQSQAIQQNLIRKMRRGRYDHRKAPKLWQYMVDAGARMYVREIGGGTVKEMFPVTVRRQLAKRYAVQFLRMLRSGEIEA